MMAKIGWLAVTGLRYLSRQRFGSVGREAS